MEDWQAKRDGGRCRALRVMHGKKGAFLTKLAFGLTICIHLIGNCYAFPAS